MQPERWIIFGITGLLSCAGLTGRTQSAKWNWVNPKITPNDIYEVSFKPGNNHIYLPTKNRYIAWSENNDLTWKKQFVDSIDTDAPEDIDFVDSLTGFVTYSYRIYKTSNGGITWTNMNVPFATVAAFKKSCFLNANTGFFRL